MEEQLNQLVMKENKLIKYDGGQLEKIKNVIAITDKLLEPANKGEQETKLQYQATQNKMQLAMLMIKKQVLKARKHKAIQDYLDMEEQMQERDKQWKQEEEQRRKEDT